MRGGQDDRPARFGDPPDKLGRIGRNAGRPHMLKHVHAGFEGVAHGRLVIDMGMHLDLVGVGSLHDRVIVFASQARMRLDDVDAHGVKPIDDRRRFLRARDDGGGFSREAVESGARDERPRHLQAWP